MEHNVTVGNVLIAIVSADNAPNSCSPNTLENIGCIEVVVVRCKGSRVPNIAGFDGVSEAFGADGQHDDDSDDDPIWAPSTPPAFVSAHPSSGSHARPSRYVSPCTKAPT